MTLQSGMVHDRKAYFWTDTGLWFADGLDLMPTRMSKVLTGSLFPFVATLSGDGMTDSFAELEPRLDRLGTETLADFAENAIRLVADRAGRGMKTRLLCAAPCPQYGIRMFLVADEALGTGPAFSANETLFYACPAPDGIAAPAGDAMPADMHAVLEKQCEQRSPNGDPTKGCVMGGAIVETVFDGRQLQHAVWRDLDG